MKRILMTLELSACHTDDTEEPKMVVDNGFRLPYIFGVALNLLVYSYLAQLLGIKNIPSRCANYLLFNELSTMLALCIFFVREHRDGRRNLVFRKALRKINSFGRGPNGDRRY